MVFTNTDVTVYCHNYHSCCCCYRMFTFGIGSGASTNLVKGLARAGNGVAEFIYERERMHGKACIITIVHVCSCRDKSTFWI